MGPQHKSCGEGTPGMDTPGGRGLQWGRSIRAAESAAGNPYDVIYLLASMGPQHKSCGEPGPAGPGRPLLQASMGPQHKSCGESNGNNCARRKPKASMGPQHKSCGETAAHRRPPPHT